MVLSGGDDDAVDKTASRVDNEVMGVIVDMASVEEANVEGVSVEVASGEVWSEDIEGTEVDVVEAGTDITEAELEEEVGTTA